MPIVSSENSPRALFITGTDTGVGKTVVTAAIAAAILAQDPKASVCVYKPIQTGSLIPEDPEQVQAWLGHPERLSIACSYTFLPPVAPWVADPQGSIDPQKIQADFKALTAQHDWVLVEGAGGVRVPIGPRYDMADLMKDLDIPVVLVSRPNLGTINHTLLSVEALQRRQLPVLGVVVSGYPETSDEMAIRTLPAVFASLLPVPVLAWLPPFALTAEAFFAPAQVSCLSNIMDTFKVT